MYKLIRPVPFPDRVEVPAPAYVPPECREAGLAELAAGRVAVLMLAGGRSTRMGGQSRWELPVGAVTGRTILQWQAERIAAVRARWANRLHWIIMTSESVKESLISVLDKHDWFGVPRTHVSLICQPSLPVFDDQGVPWSDGIRVPTGNGAMLHTLHAAGELERLAANGVTTLYVFMFPNVLERVCDPVMLGLHRLGAHEVTVKAVEPASPDEQTGRVAWTRDRLVVVEYHAITTPEQCALLAHYPVFAGAMICSVDFLARRAPHPLPFHQVRHHEPGQARAAWKAEQFLMDMLADSTSTCFHLARRASDYAVVKRPCGPDSLDTARASLAAEFRTWLARAGAIGPATAERIEISPAFALDAEELISRLGEGFPYSDGLCL